jgi:hypothetical protein
MSTRKYHLFVAACWRAIWHRFSASERQVVKAYERFAAGLTPKEDRDWEVALELHENLSARVWEGEVGRGQPWEEETSEVAAVLSVTGMPESWKDFSQVQRVTRLYEAAVVTAGACALSAWRQQRCGHCDLLRDLFGPLPFRPLPPMAPSVLRGNDRLIKRLAEEAYKHRIMPAGTLDPDRLAVLADALEEAGADAALVAHLREPGPHWRGCHAVDLLMGKS